METEEKPDPINFASCKPKNNAKINETLREEAFHFKKEGTIFIPNTGGALQFSFSWRPKDA